MAVTYSHEKKLAVKNLVQFSQAIAEQLRGMMEKTGIDHVRGAQLLINVFADDTLDSIVVSYGRPKCDAGTIYTRKGVMDDEWTVNYTNTSDEYQRLFDAEMSGSGRPEGESREKELPPDGLWLSAYRDIPDVDSGV